jgi:hypothetical protein
MKTSYGNLPKKVLGICIKNRSHIVIDLTKDENILRVYLHEMLHARYPKESERVIQLMENEVWSWLGQKEIYLLGRLLFGRPFREV